MEFWPKLPKITYNFGQWWQARLCILYATIFWSTKKLSKLGLKIDFLAHFKSFFVYAVIHNMRYTPRFCQMKALIKMDICGTFHQYSICGCEIKNFPAFYMDSVSMKWLPLGLYSPKYCLILLKTLTISSLR